MYHAKFKTQFGTLVHVSEGKYETCVARCDGCKEDVRGTMGDLQSKLIPWAQSHAAACRAVR